MNTKHGLSKFRIRETPTLSTAADRSTDTNYIGLQWYKKRGGGPQHLPVFKAPRKDDP